MIDWLQQLRDMTGRDSAVIIVTVVAVYGSAPREVGAKILISETQQWGTVGGGNLEFEAIAIARHMLAVITERAITERAAPERAAPEQSSPEQSTTERAISGPASPLNAAKIAAPFVREFALGPSLGQCCGGRVKLFFESVNSSTAWLQQAVTRVSRTEPSAGFTQEPSAGFTQEPSAGFTQEPSAGFAQEPSAGFTQEPSADSTQEPSADFTQTDNCVWLCRSLSDSAGFKFIEQGQSDWFPSLSQPANCTARLIYAEEDIVNYSKNAAWWCETLTPKIPEVWLFGAGHVGHALLAQLQLLRCKVVIVDCREDQLQNLPASVRVIATDCCATEVEFAPAGVWFLVMTHSHAIDFDICNAVLKRTDFSYLGLIGSATKKATFVKRLASRGIEQRQIDRLSSPIGLTTIRSRQPQLIALGVATDLSLRWQDIY